MNFPKFQRLVEERTGFRTMENATASGEYFSDSCGDMYNFFLKVGPGAVIEDISYFTTGCGFGTATCSLVVELAKGKTIDEASRLRPARSSRSSTDTRRRRKIIPSERSRRSRSPSPIIAAKFRRVRFPIIPRCRARRYRSTWLPPRLQPQTATPENCSSSCANLTAGKRRACYYFVSRRAVGRIGQGFEERQALHRHRDCGKVH